MPHDEPARHHSDELQSSELQPSSPEWRAAYDTLLAYAFNALSRRALSSAELRQRVGKRAAKHGEEAAELLTAQVLERVQELGYQDDAQVAEIEARRRGVGPYRIRQKLRQRGVADEVIAEALEGRDADTEREEARKLLAGRLGNFARKKNPRASAYAFLARRGYDSSLVRELLEDVEDELPEPERRGGWGRW